MFYTCFYRRIIYGCLLSTSYDKLLCNLSPSQFAYLQTGTVPVCIIANCPGDSLHIWCFRRVLGPEKAGWGDLESIQASCTGACQPVHSGASAVQSGVSAVQSGVSAVHSSASAVHSAVSAVQFCCVCCAIYCVCCALCCVCCAIYCVCCAICCVCCAI